MKNIRSLGFLGLLIFFLGSGCSLLDFLWEETAEEPDQTYRVQQTVGSGQSVYVVKINLSDSRASSARTGSVEMSVSAAGPGREFNVQGNPETEGPVYRMGHPRQEEINQILASLPQNTEQMRSRQNAERSITPLQVGITARTFWVESEVNQGGWVQKTATLRAGGTRCNVWVANENYSESSSVNTINASQAQALADKFDQIYDLETPIFGYEYGGGPGGNGGVDGDPKIQILVFDIDGDGGRAGGAVTLGYFYSGDYYLDSQVRGRGLHSNQGEIFYIDAYITNTSPNMAYSTLVHEFQHMINFNVKYIGPRSSTYYDAWYTEMLSMLAEDLISPLIGIDSTHYAHPIKQRIPIFLEKYFLTGVTEWNSSSVDLNLASYSNVYAFGAYLARNYGGAALIKEIAQNNKINTASISAGLSRFNPGMDFKQALSRYGNAVVHGLFPSTTPQQIGGTNYAFSGFNLGSILRYSGVVSGILTQPLNCGRDLPGNSLMVEKFTPAVPGTVELTITKPSNIDIHVYVR